LFQDKLWAAADPERRPTKRAKDELDLMRIAETHPKYLPLLPPALRAGFNRGPAIRGNRGYSNKGT
jgi:hypothetical protein